MKLDLKNRKIMELLGRNCRISHTEIARTLRVSKDTVTYRIRALEEDGYLDSNVLFIDPRKLGFTVYHLLLRFDAGLGKRKQLYRRIARKDFVMWVNTFVGRYDLQIIVYAQDAFHLDAIREELFDECDHKVKDYTILTHLFDFEFTHMNPSIEVGVKYNGRQDTSFSNLLMPRSFAMQSSFDRYKPDRYEVKLLKGLSDDPQASLVDLADSANCDRQTARRKIEMLIKRGVIINFGAIPNISKLGYVTYYLLVRLSQDTSNKLLQKPFKKLRNIFYAGRMIGDYDMILYLNARSPGELYEALQLFREDLEKYILNYDLLLQESVQHWRQFTPGLYKTLLQQAAK